MSTTQRYRKPYSGSALVLAALAGRGRKASGSVYALLRPAGHHAMRDMALGFGLLASQLGLVSLLQTSFAGLAGYAVAILNTRYGWPPGASAVAALGIVAATALSFGLITLRTTGIGFMMLTLVLGQMLWALTFQWVDLTRGMDGIIGIAAPHIAGIHLASPTVLYACAALTTVAAYAAAHLLIASRFGLLLRGIQDNPVRMRALGYSVKQARLVLFVLASLPAALGGILLAWEARIVSPVSLDLSRAIFVLTAAVLGGYRALLGGPIGVVLMVALEAVISRYTERHLAVFGTVLAFAILLLPNGIAACLATRRLSVPVWRWKRPSPDDVSSFRPKHGDSP